MGQEKNLGDWSIQGLQAALDGSSALYQRAEGGVKVDGVGKDQHFYMNTPHGEMQVFVNPADKTVRASLMVNGKWQSLSEDGHSPATQFLKDALAAVKDGFVSNAEGAKLEANFTADRAASIQAHKNSGQKAR